MSKQSKQQSSNVIELKPAKPPKASEQKWGKPVMALGFCIVPSLLLRAQRRLGINATELAVLMHLADFWWQADRKPHPSKEKLAERLNLSPRQVQRIIAGLEQAGLVKRIERRKAHKGKTSNEYDLSGLVRRLKELEPEFRKAEEEAKKRRQEVTRPGLRPRAKEAR